MALRARYDPQADRMRLTLQPAEGPARSFWLTRRQWLGWLHALLASPLPQPAADASAVAQETNAPKPRPRRQDDEGQPEVLKAIRLRRAGDRLQVAFVAEGGQAVTLSMAPEGVRQMRELLEQQAERAGWDAAAAMARLNAAAIATVALGKARRLH